MASHGRRPAGTGRRRLDFFNPEGLPDRSRGLSMATPPVSRPQAGASRKDARNARPGTVTRNLSEHPNHNCPASHPGGISDRSRGLSTATPPVSRPHVGASPSGSQLHCSGSPVRDAERAKPNHIARWVTPRWGLECCGVVGSQGVALGYRVDAPLARKTLRTKGAKPVSPGHRPGSPATTHIPI